MNQKEAILYLEKLDCEETDRPGAEALKRMVRAHLERIPFENLDIFDFGKVPDLSEEELFEKIVTNDRGGVCFELNLSFYSLLKALGYQVYPVAARILWNKSQLPPLTHAGLVVEVEGGTYYCDVGYGGPGPKGLMMLNTEEQEIGGYRFRFRILEDGDYRLERLFNEGWKPLLQFTDRPVKRLDFQVLNYYCASNPVIMFTQKRVINLCTPDGSKALMDMELTVHEGDRVRRRRYENMKELETGLEEEFGIRVSLAESRWNTDGDF